MSYTDVLQLLVLALMAVSPFIVLLIQMAMKKSPAREGLENVAAILERPQEELPPETQPRTVQRQSNANPVAGMTTFNDAVVQPTQNHEKEEVAPAAAPMVTMTQPVLTQEPERLQTIIGPVVIVDVPVPAAAVPVEDDDDDEDDDDFDDDFDDDEEDDDFEDEDDLDDDEDEEEDDDIVEDDAVSGVLANVTSILRSSLLSDQIPMIAQQSNPVVPQSPAEGPDNTSAATQAGGGAISNPEN